MQTTLTAQVTPMPQDQVAVLEGELNWLGYRLHRRMAEAYQAKTDMPEVESMDLRAHDTPYGDFMAAHGFGHDERLVVMLALAAHFKPGFFDYHLGLQVNRMEEFPMLGCVHGKKYHGWLPTICTALFLLGGSDSTARMRAMGLFQGDHPLVKNHILLIEPAEFGEPVSSSKISLASEYIELFTQGKVATPRFGVDFPAQQATTDMEWGDLVLPPQTLAQVANVEQWLAHGGHLARQWKQGKNKFKPGYRALFHGPPGTGKTLTAALLGKHAGLPVYKIDLSLVVSKYIGETEKNLANLFDKAEDKGWILFFDEADALFGKRTSVRDAHDKYANQEVSFLLQRTEHYSGLVILATNFKGNIDEAFTRRFQSHVYFPLPGPGERLRLWEKSFPDYLKPSPAIDLAGWAQQYELTGAHIINVVQYACLKALGNQRETISEKDLLEGVQNELGKEGR